MSRRVYVSTGGAQGTTAVAWANSYLNQHQANIELSGGSYDPIAQANCVALAERAKIMLHNYYPPPKEAFVLNLASLDPILRERTRTFIVESLQLSSEIQSDFYGIHAGWFATPRVEQLGKRIDKSAIADRELAHRVFLDEVEFLADQAASLGIRLLVENHAISSVNFRSFGDNFLMMTNPVDIVNVMEELWPRVGLLLDVGHLNVSAQTLDFSPIDAMRSLEEFCVGYHLSDNSGKADDHAAFDTDAWFLEALPRSAAFYTVEVHESGSATNGVARSVEAIAAFLDGSD